MTTFLEWARLAAAVLCSITPLALLLLSVPQKDLYGHRHWTFTTLDWFLRFSMAGFVWSNAYALWEGVINEYPPTPRTLIVAIASAYLAAAALLLTVRAGQRRLHRHRAGLDPNHPIKDDKEETSP